MGEFLTRAISVVAVVVCLTGYNTVLDKREQAEEQIRKQQAELEQSANAAKEGTITDGAYKDGTYTGTGKGYSGTITLTAKIKKGMIKSLEAEHTDTPMFFKKAWDILENEIIQNQSVDGIDTVSGATLSSEGILGAAQKALAQAKK